MSEGGDAVRFAPRAHRPATHSNNVPSRRVRPEQVGAQLDDVGPRLHGGARLGEAALPDSDPKACLAMDPRRFETLVAIMGVLRSESGCPWDKAQTHVSLARYLLEECYKS